VKERLVYFEDERAKARWLDAAASLDAHSPSVRAKARELAQSKPSAAVAAHALFRFVRDAIEYRRDVPWTRGRTQGRERLDSAEVVLSRGWDDCDGKARLLVALARASGRRDLEARIRPVFQGTRFTHVQAELRFPGSRMAGVYRNADTEGWVPAETILRRARLGDLAGDVPREPDGRWLT
jgi:transglutaminase-like putative cysteine protease